MSNEIILTGNKFVNCTRSELLSLWYGFKRMCTEGRATTDNPLTPYKDAYCKKSNIAGLLLTELDLLIAIAYEFCENDTSTLPISNMGCIHDWICDGINSDTCGVMYKYHCPKCGKAITTIGPMGSIKL